MRTFLLTAALAATTYLSQAWAEPIVYNIEPTHTFVTFEAVHFATSTNRGRFDKKEGTVQLDKVAKSGKIELILDTGSINTGTPDFDAHLRTINFLNSTAFPTAKFVSTSFVFSGDKVSEVNGQLTMLGKTQPVVLKANRFNCYVNPKLKREICGGDFETTIQRSRWGMDFGVAFGIPDSVRLVIQVEAVQQ